MPSTLWSPRRWRTPVHTLPSPGGHLLPKTEPAGFPVQSCSGSGRRSADHTERRGRSVPDREEALSEERPTQERGGEGKPCGSCAHLNAG